MPEGFSTGNRGPYHSWHKMRAALDSLGTVVEERMLNASTEVRREQVRLAGTDFCSALGRER